MKVICSMVVSIDGFIANEAGDSVSTSPDWEEFRKLAKQYNNFVVGRNTFAKGNLDNIDCDFKIIVSTRPVAASKFIVADSPEDVLSNLSGKVDTIYLVGGGQLNTAFLRAGLINELVLTIQPKIIGNGTKVFDELGVESELSLLESEELNDNRVKLRYEVSAPV
jgi:dihydrofolate reductase